MNELDIQMNYFFIATTLILLCGCNSAPERAEPNSIAEEEAEIQQLESLVFCGNALKVMEASDLIHIPLKKAWDTVLGEENREFCSLTVGLDGLGNIVTFSAVDCKNTEALKEVIKLVPPIEVPTDKCIFHRIQEIEYAINETENES
jgi:hypothetical protein